jgi:cyclopropane-fatty-acyl-phospholipid synthase
MNLPRHDAWLSAATAAVERGWVPDPAVRWGIRRLCVQRLRQQTGVIEDSGGDRAALARFIDRLRTSEIALLPEKANQQHYEVPADLFRLMLGPRLKYSCCWWEKGAGSLAAAEDVSLRLTSTHAGIEDGMRVLELGCGWGSLTLWLAEHYPHCSIVSVSNSASQRAFIEAAARERGLSNVSIVTADMNVFDADRRFDRVVSVEMFEHMRNHSALLSRIARWIEPDGRLFIHVFCHRRFAYEFDTDGAQNWMGRHFFTGGLMPSADLLPSLPSPFALEDEWRWPGMHYARTAEAWLANLDARSGEVLHALQRAYGHEDASRWLQRWRIFLMACAELFGYAGGSEWGVAHYRFRPSAR